MSSSWSCRKRVDNFSRATVPLDDKNGQPIIDALGIANRWTEQFAAVEGGTSVSLLEIVERALTIEVGPSRFTGSRHFAGFADFLLSS